MVPIDTPSLSSRDVRSLFLTRGGYSHHRNESPPHATLKDRRIRPVVIENLILNSPCRESKLHFRFDANDQMTSLIDAGPRHSTYYPTISVPKMRAAPRLFDNTEE